MIKVEQGEKSRESAAPAKSACEERCKVCGAPDATWWEIETGDVFCGLHARGEGR